MKILIVDDSETSRLLLEAILRSEGYKDLLLASTAAEGLRLLDQMHGETQGPGVDLVLMDIVMPGMNGIEATRLIKSDRRLKDIPIIMVTIQDEEESLERAFEAGAIDYINKPLNRIELRARVRSVLRLKHEMDKRKAREEELSRLTRRLEEISNQDGLTGVGNRRFFDAILDGEWRRARRDGDPVSLLMIDIDYFKNYNDTYGHLQGDACLKAVADSIRSVLKRPGDFLARYGGEEFGVILPDTGLDGSMAIAEEVRAELAAKAIPHASSGAGSRVSVSIGVACLHAGSLASHEDLLRAADTALYAAKRNGRDRIEVARGSCGASAEK